MLPALIGAGATIAGGLISNRASRNQAAAEQAAQREFAQHGIRWKVADAKAAGIHPLYALGASTHSYSPVMAGDSLGAALGQAGQDIGRAIHATATAAERREQEQRLAEAARRAEAREIERHHSGLANDEVQRQWYAAQIASLRQKASGPPSPAVTSGVSSGGVPAGAFTPVLGSAGRGVTKASEAISHSRGNAGLEAMATPGLKRYRFGPGSWQYLDLPGQQLSESLEGLGFPAAQIAGATILGSSLWERGSRKVQREMEAYRAYARRARYEAWRRSEKRY